MNLSAKQHKFIVLTAKLISWADKQGYWLGYGEAYRTPEQAHINAQRGAGISNSLHTERLAIDLVLRINGEYQTDSNAYKPLGDYWKSLDPEACWGGDFKKPDGNHFSLSHNGIK